MQCDRCHRGRARASKYFFYYGHRYGSAAASAAKGEKGYTYSIVGQSSAWICDRCVTRAFWLRIVTTVLAFGLAGVVIYLVFSRSDFMITQPVLFVALDIVVLVLLLTMIRNQPGGRNEVGESLAIKVDCKRLKAQGYNGFLTSNGYKRSLRNR
jgi:hypothetical protein